MQMTIGHRHLRTISGFDCTAFDLQPGRIQSISNNPKRGAHGCLLRLLVSFEIARNIRIPKAR